jgi:hypothetical protein
VALAHIGAWTKRVQKPQNDKTMNACFFRFYGETTSFHKTI